jgi:hypothetical protein
MQTFSNFSIGTKKNSFSKSVINWFLGSLFIRKIFNILKIYVDSTLHFSNKKPRQKFRANKMYPSSIYRPFFFVI